MILTKTVKVKLETSIYSVMPTIKAYTESFNHVCAVGWKDSDHNAVSLHNKTYKHCRTLLLKTILVGLLSASLL